MTTREVLSSFRLDGLEPDNLLAFLALLGVLRVLNRVDAALLPRVSWTLDNPPIRPCLHIRTAISTFELTERIAQGIHQLAADYTFSGRKDLNYKRNECRSLLASSASNPSRDQRGRGRLLSALMSDAAVKDEKEQIVDPTPLCLLFGQGHQHFLERLSSVPLLKTPPPRGRGKSATTVSEEDCISEALFHAWHRDDPTQSFRWDPNEDVRYAMMAGDPTDSAFKSGTQHGANRLAAIGLSALTLVPESRAGRVRPHIIGGTYDSSGFSFAWPVWREPASFGAIVAMLTHPELRTPGALRNLSVDHVLVARRISVGKFMNFSRARSISLGIE